MSFKSISKWLQNPLVKCVLPAPNSPWRSIFLYHLFAISVPNDIMEEGEEIRVMGLGFVKDVCYSLSSLVISLLIGSHFLISRFAHTLFFASFPIPIKILFIVDYRIVKSLLYLMLKGYLTSQTKNSKYEFFCWLRSIFG